MEKAGKMLGEMPEKSRKNTRVKPGKSPENAGEKARKMPGEMPEKMLEKKPRKTSPGNHPREKTPDKNL